MEVTERSRQGVRERPWTVRYTWQAAEGFTYPMHTFEGHGSETHAIDAAVAMFDLKLPAGGMRMVGAHIKGPGLDWRLIDL